MTPGRDGLPESVVLVLAGLLVGVGIAGSWAPRALPTFLVVVLALLTTVSFLRDPPRTRPDRRQALALLGLALVLVVLGARSAYRDLSLGDGLLLMGYGMAFVLVRRYAEGPRWRPLLVGALALGGAGAALVGLGAWAVTSPGSAEAASVRGTFGYPNALAGYLLLTFFPVAALARASGGPGRWAWSAGGAVVAGALLLTRSRGAALVLVAVGAGWLGVSLMGRWGRRGLPGFALVGGLLLLGGAVAARLPHWAGPATGGDTSLAWRTEIYGWTWQMVRDHFPWGTGPGTFPLMIQRYQRLPYVTGRAAHNAYLQALAELGVVGAGLVILLGLGLWRGIRAARRASAGGRERLGLAALVAGVTASGLHAGVDADWTFPGIALSATVATALLWDAGADRAGPGGQPRRILGLAVALAALAVGGVAIVRHYAEAAFQEGKWALSQGIWARADAELTLASRLDPLMYGPRYWRAVLYLARGEAPRALAEAEAAVRLNPHDGEAVFRLGQLYRATGRPDAARRAFLAAVAMEPSAHLLFYRDLVDLLAAEGRRGQALELIAQARARFPLPSVLDPVARCLAPGDRYLYAGLLEWEARLRGSPASADLWAEAQRLREPSPAEICQRRLRPGFTSPEATLVTYWTGAAGREPGQLGQNLERGIGQRPGAPGRIPAFSALGTPRTLRIVELDGNEWGATVVYEVDVDGVWVRQANRLTLRDDFGWILDEGS